MSVHQVGSMSEFKRYVSSANLTVIDCFATWCGPCQAIAPKVAQLAQEHPQVQFIKVDVDQVSDVSAHLNIKAMPTFIFMKSDSEITRFEGANEARLKELIAQYGTVSEGRKLGGNSPQAQQGLAGKEVDDAGRNAMIEAMERRKREAKEAAQKQ